VATHLLEAGAWHQAVKPVCSCGHSASFDPHGLWWHFERRHWDTRLEAVRLRFWCTLCRSQFRQKRTPVRLDLVASSAADIQLPLPPKHVWRKVQRRMR